MPLLDMQSPHLLGQSLSGLPLLPTLLGNFNCFGTSHVLPQPPKRGTSTMATLSLNSLNKAHRFTRQLTAAQPWGGAGCLNTYPIRSTRSQSTLGVGTSGEPSYKTTAAPVARTDTIQFHIIQPTWNRQEHSEN